MQRAKALLHFGEIGHHRFNNFSVSHSFNTQFCFLDTDTTRYVFAFLAKLEFRSLLLIDF